VLFGAFACFRFLRPPALCTILNVRPPGPPNLASLDDTPHNLPCPNTEEPAQPLDTTVCEVVQRPEAFACKRVRLRATLLTDCLEHSALVGSRCERSLLPLGHPSPQVDAFFSDACAARPFDFETKRTATFTGRFRLRSEDQGTVFALEIERVANVKITPPPGLKPPVGPQQRVP
jgi:hypothetical protein